MSTPEPGSASEPAAGMSAQHTPGPWKALRRWSCTRIEDGKGRFVGETKEEADAAFIVRSVNNHADLLAALKACVERLQASDPPSNGATSMVISNAMEMIARAKGSA